ncbi:MAG: T9SS type A sorting domain-containing protein [Bacteroidota bacterium]
MIRNLLRFILLLFLIPGVATAQQPGQPMVSVASYFDVSPPLRSVCDRVLKKSDQSWKDGVVKNYFWPAGHPQAQLPFSDQVTQKTSGLKTGDSILQNFEGSPNISFVVPPDACGAAGPGHYFQIVNFISTIYDKSGAKLLGPFNSGLIWIGMPHNSSNGDGIVLYDKNADRWLVSQLSLPDYPNGPFYQMIAVSQTPDPTGSWFRWEYAFNDIPDYPKFGIWHDGYYMSYNRIRAGGMPYDGTGAAAFDRAAMLSGDPGARMILFLLNSGEDAYSIMPADCDGDFPAQGTPEYFLFIQRNYLGVLEFHTDWNSPSNSLYGNYTRIQVSPFLNNLEGIPQKGTASTLNPINDRLMFRLHFRKFADHQSMVVNHTVDVGSATGIRWYELRRTTENWYVYQQSTYAPDSNSRWMGSIAMDVSGNMAMGYSTSGPDLHPSIRYTGRMAHDPLNQMTIAERSIVQGGGSQTGVWGNGGRWGDYSSMAADPVIPRTFWYTQEYYDSTSVSSWKTRITSFSFANVLSMDATATPAVICTGGNCILNISVSGGTGNYYYEWKSDPPGLVACGKEITVTPDSSMKYIARVYDGQFVCTDTLSVTVLPLPSVFPGNDTSYCHYIEAIPLSGRGSNVISVKWTTTGDGEFSDETSLNTLYFPGSKDKRLASVDLKLSGLPQAPCLQVIALKHIEFKPCPGIGDWLPDEQVVNVFPNPSGGKFCIRVNQLQPAPLRIEILNPKGELVFSASVPASPRVCNVKPDLSHLPGGIYLLKVKTNDRMVIRKIILQK